MSKSVDKGTVKELAGTLQNAALLPGVRVAAAESLLAASKSGAPRARAVYPRA
mgnify:CR=1 FL=1